MSEVEGVRVAHNVQPISTSAIAKIRKLGSTGQLDAKVEGLDDVFAQVFAHITDSGSVEPIAAADERSNQDMLGGENLAPSSENEQQPNQEEPFSDSSTLLVVPVIANESLRDRSEDPLKVPQANSDLDEAISPEITPDQDSAEENLPQDDTLPVIVENDQRISVQPVVFEENQSDSEIVDSQNVETTTKMVSDEGEEAGRRNRDKENEEVPQELVVREASRSSKPTEESKRAVTNFGSNSKQSGFAAETNGGDQSQRPRRSRNRRGVNEAVRTNESGPQSRSAEESLLRALKLQNAAAGQANSALEAVDPRLIENPAKLTRQMTPMLGAVSQVAMNASRFSVGAANGPAGGGDPLATMVPVEQKTSSAAAKASTAAKAAKANTAETVSRVKLIQRVSKAFQHLGPDGGTVRLRLAPAELGSVRVEMRIHQRTVQARVVAETEAASTVLREHLPELRQRLESQGMQIERLEVELGSRDRDTGDFRQHQDHEQQQSQWRSRSAVRKPSASSDSSRPQIRAEVSRAIPTTLSQDGVDVRL